MQSSEIAEGFRLSQHSVWAAATDQADRGGQFWQLGREPHGTDLLPHTILGGEGCSELRSSASAAKIESEEKDPKQNSEENQKVQVGIISSSVLDPITENEPEESNEAQEALADDKEKDEDAVKDGNNDEDEDPETDKVKSLQRRLSSQKSFEMEDLIGKSNF